VKIQVREDEEEKSKRKRNKHSPTDLFYSFRNKSILTLCLRSLICIRLGSFKDNMERLAGAAAPMNMNDWQSQQRIQKEKERNQKTEAAEGLRTHRGGVREDDAKIMALKVEERKKQQEAEEFRHNYRGQSNPNAEVKAKPVRQDPTHPPPVNVSPLNTRAEVGTLCAPGSVSAMAANFKNLETSVSEGSDSPELVESIAEEKKMEGEPVPENMDTPLPVQTDEPPQPVELAVASEEEQVEPEPVDASPDIEEPEVVTEPEIAMVKPKEDEADEAVMKSTTSGDASVDAQDEPLQGHPTVVRLDVLFSFGLVTTKKEPSFAGYLVATEDIIKETLDQNAELSEHVSYDSMYGPFVQECTVDGKSAHGTLRSSLD
jgi:hypothetical protein